MAMTVRVGKETKKVKYYIILRPGVKLSADDKRTLAEHSAGQSTLPSFWMHGNRYNAGLVAYLFTNGIAFGVTKINIGNSESLKRAVWEQVGANNISFHTSV